MNTATILMKDLGPTEPGLDFFPFGPGQYLDAEVAENPDGEGVLVTLCLGDAADLTAGQEQYLNTHDAVLGYQCDQSVEDLAADED